MVQCGPEKGACTGHHLRLISRHEVKAPALPPRRCCGSSVVEHTLGKGEVESSILSHSTIYHFNITGAWNHWLARHGFPSLWQIALKNLFGKFGMPFLMPPYNDDPTMENTIARNWVQVFSRNAKERATV